MCTTMPISVTLIGSTGSDFTRRMVGSGNSATRGMSLDTGQEQSTQPPMGRGTSAFGSSIQPRQPLPRSLTASHILTLPQASAKPSLTFNFNLQALVNERTDFHQCRSGPMRPKVSDAPRIDQRPLGYVRH